MKLNSICFPSADWGSPDCYLDSKFNSGVIGKVHVLIFEKGERRWRFIYARRIQQAIGSPRIR